MVKINFFVEYLYRCIFFNKDLRPKKNYFLCNEFSENQFNFSSHLFFSALFFITKGRTGWERGNENQGYRKKKKKEKKKKEKINKIFIPLLLINLEISFIVLLMWKLNVFLMIIKRVIFFFCGEKTFFYVVFLLFSFFLVSW